ncbi:MAG TPA: sugar phosphate nucleotidyltransferase [Terriglobales bacterium]|nr:sugar phosphate nucleotidyltransferase [Terriglobales bacterium]
MAKTTSHFYPVILAGGSGTRFWPRSRKANAKQVLALDGKDSMIQQTVARLSQLSKPDHFWVITNGELQKVIGQQLKKQKLKKGQIIAEPAARNTAPAIGLAAFILQRIDKDAVIGMFPADHVIGDEKTFRSQLDWGLKIAASGQNIVVLGIPPSHPETGYGYIETGASMNDGVFRVRRFTEKPSADKAAEFVAAKNFFWNSGMFLWTAQTLVNAMREHLPQTAPLLEQIAAAYGTRKFEKVFAQLYPKCENISIDYAVLEPRSAKGELASNLFCIKADFKWNDLGSWSALWEHRNSGDGDAKDGNVFEAKETYALNAEKNFVHAPKKFVAVIGVKDLVVVETEDALLITTREHSQDVGKVVKHLVDKGLKTLI